MLNDDQSQLTTDFDTFLAKYMSDFPQSTLVPQDVKRQMSTLQAQVAQATDQPLTTFQPQTLLKNSFPYTESYVQEFVTRIITTSDGADSLCQIQGCNTTCTHQPGPIHCNVDDCTIIPPMHFAKNVHVNQLQDGNVVAYEINDKCQITSTKYTISPKTTCPPEIEQKKCKVTIQDGVPTVDWDGKTCTTGQYFPPTGTSCSS